MTINSYKQFFYESIANIKKFYDNEQLVLFLGSGVAYDSGMPKWKELIDTLADELNIDKDNRNDFLKIAQMYYVQFGENMYYKKLLNIFDLQTKDSNPTIDRLVQLNCKYIITTNWDDLIEKAIAKYGLFYDIVKKDDDFSKIGSNTNALIKIHGDLEERNIVFKEDDYLNYETNFPLMHRFLTSLFVRNVFLFIGYSLSDFNIQQIISWVQNKRDKNLPIYFLEVRKEFDCLEFEYYKNKNIYVLYLKSMEDVL